MRPVAAAGSRLARCWVGRFALAMATIVAFGWIGLLETNSDVISAPLFVLAFGVAALVAGWHLQPSGDRGADLQTEPSLLYRSDGGRQMRADVWLVGGSVTVIEGLVAFLIFVGR